MKKFTGLLLILILLGLTTYTSVWARGGGGGGTNLSSGGGGGGHFRGGGGHFRGGSHFRGGFGHRHYGGRHHHRRSFGLGFGGFYGPGFYGTGFFGYPYWNRYRSPYYYPRSVYSYPYARMAPSARPVYIEKPTVSTSTQTAQSLHHYWYYCRNPDGYYPYVKQCPEGWLQVAPQPVQ